MIIEKCNRLVRFKDVQMGAVFEYNRTIYIKVSPIEIMDCDGKDETVCNAIDLQYGYNEVFKDDIEVHIYENAKVVLI